MRRKGGKMKITLYSNYMNNLVIPLCDAFANTPGVEFHFVAMEPMSEERLALGFEDVNAAYPYCVRAYESEKEAGRALSLAMASDAVIVGSAPLFDDRFIDPRLREDKLTFRYSERLFKHPRWMYMLYPRYRKAIYEKHSRYKRGKQYMLCASSYTKGDFRSFGLYQDKALKWGYFPEAFEQDIGALMDKKRNDPPLLLWCGRMVDWKRPDQALRLAKRLKDADIAFRMTLAGGGPMEEKVRQEIGRLALEDAVQCTGMLPNGELRALMEEASIYLFTSNKREGWGAVLNEAMNAGCAPLACESAGATGYLIGEGSGISYKDEDQLLEGVALLLRNPDVRRAMGVQSYQSICDIWNADVAAQRFLAMTEALKDGGPVPELFKTGPCSPA